ncbi:MAG: preprotein translocase subunit SecG [Gammaproteobacteria bacterium]|nr:MAG: preprotein translocase subunit SecG [Gammaproteobacteria bacterium]
METILLIIHVLVALALIGLVLIQQGKGADMGAGFGSGASGTVFGASGSGSFMSRLTAGVAAAFFIMTIVLAIISGQTAENKDVISEALDEPAVVETVDMDADDAPAAPTEDVEATGGAVEEDEVPAAPVKEISVEEAEAKEAVEDAKAAVKEAAEKVEEKVEQAEEAVKEAAEDKPAQ